MRLCQVLIAAAQHIEQVVKGAGLTPSITSKGIKLSLCLNGSPSNPDNFGNSNI